jgi:hypothetical protein
VRRSDLTLTEFIKALPKAPLEDFELEDPDYGF